MTKRQRNARGEGGQLRQDILAAAINLIERAGTCEAVSLRAVAKEVGIAAPSVYPHFADREVLLLAILQQLFDELIAQRNQAEDEVAAAGGGPWDRLRAGVFATVRFGLDRPGHYKMLYEGGVISGLNDPMAAAFGRPIQIRVAGLIREILHGVPGRDGEDAERLALLLWCGSHGVISLQINKPTLPWPEASTLVDDLMHAIIRPTGG